MPNWCENTVTLSHANPAMIARVKKAFAAGNLFNEFIPMPPGLQETEAWYDWALENWGTKWDVEGDIILEQGRAAEEAAGTDVFRTIARTPSVKLAFRSAWSPPIPIYEKLSAEGFYIEASYSEEAMEFCGEWSTYAKEVYYDYAGWTYDEIKAKIPTRLIEEYCIMGMVNADDDPELVPAR